jgi:hypothetical protein
MPLRGILDCHKMVANPTDVAERADCLRRICQECFLKGRLSPGLGDDFRAVARPDFSLVEVNDGV